MDSKHIWAVLGLLLICLSLQAWGLECHDCWTKDDDSCFNRITLTDDTLWECGPKENVCKKIVTNYYKVIKRGLHASETLLSNVTSRLCGHADWTGCRKMLGAASTTVECVCSENRCNGAEQHLGTISVTMFICGILATMLQFLR